MGNADPKQVAKALKQKHVQMFNAVSREELEGGRWDKPDAATACPNIMAIIGDYNKISYQVQFDILLVSSKEEQQKNFEFYIHLMNEASAIGDYHTAEAIYMGLNAAPISRLHPFLHNNETGAIFEKHQNLFSPLENRKNLRKEITEEMKKNGTFVPVLTLTLQQLVSANEIKHDNELNAKKITAAAIQEFDSYKTIKSPTVITSPGSDWFDRAKIIPKDKDKENEIDKKFYDISLAIKPRRENAKAWQKKKTVKSQVTALSAFLSEMNPPVALQSQKSNLLAKPPGLTPPLLAEPPGLRIAPVTVTWKKGKAPQSWKKGEKPSSSSTPKNKG